MSDEFNFEISRLGADRVPSPLKGIHFVKDGERMLFQSGLDDVNEYIEGGKAVPSFERAGPREKIYFDPSKLKCGIVTCGGLCPGLNSVIRAVVLCLYHSYGVNTVYGFMYGYEGLVSRHGHAPLILTTALVERIHQQGGTILGSSRGNQDIGIFLRDRIHDYFKRTGTAIVLKYIDPSYTIRSVPANANDSAFCLLLGQNAVHAGMAGRTDLVVGFWFDKFTHVPIPVATSKRKKIDPEGWVWNSVIASTGQPKEMS